MPIFLGFVVTVILLGVYILALKLYAFPWHYLMLEAWGLILSGAALLAVVLRFIIALPSHFSSVECWLFALLPVLAYALIKLNRKCDLEWPFRGVTRFLRWLFIHDVSWLFTPFIFLATPFIALFLFVKEYVVLFKKDYCPRISWD